MSKQEENIVHIERTVTEAKSDLQSVDPIVIENYNGITFKTVLVFLALVCATFAQLINVVGAGAFARNVAQSIGGVSKDIWLIQINVICTCVLGPPVSYAADLWGRKWLVVASMLFGVVGSIILSRATTMQMAIAGQVIIGLGFGAQALLFAVASEILPRRYRPIAQGVVSAAVACGGFSGLLVGSALIKHSPAGWRPYWYMDAGLFAFSAVVVGLFYNPPPRALQRSLSTTQKLHRLDWVGSGLLAAGLVLFNLALTWSNNPFPWSDPHILAPFVLGILLSAALGIHQKFYKKDGLFHHDLFRKDRNFTVALICIALEGVLFFAWNTFFTFETSVLYETDPVRIGLQYSVFFFTLLVFSLVGGAISSRWKALREPTVFAFLTFLIFSICMATATLSSSQAIWGFIVIPGIGGGFALVSIVSVAQLSAPPELIAITTGLAIGVRSLGGSVALPIYNAILNSKLTTALPAQIAKQVLPRGLPASSLKAFITALASKDQTLLRSVPGVTPEIAEAGVLGLKQAYLYSFRYVWITTGAVAAFGAVVACFTINPKDDFNMHVDAPLEDESPARHSQERDSETAT